MVVKNSLPDADKERSGGLLNKHVAASIDLAFQAKQAHWNVTGPNFIGVHGLCDEVYAKALEYADRFAERARALDQEVRGTVADCRVSPLKPYKLGVAGWEEHMAAMTAAIVAYAKSTRTAAEESAADLATQNAFIDATEDFDKLYFLVSRHLAKD